MSTKMIAVCDRCGVEHDGQNHPGWRKLGVDAVPDRGSQMIGHFGNVLDGREQADLCPNCVADFVKFWKK